jgi:hypothetical protein
MNTRQLLTSLVAAVAIGWLGGGTCFVSYCSEDCDACIQQCKCKTSTCNQSGAAFQATHALVAFERSDEAGSDGALQRVFTDIVGLSVQRAGGPAVPGAEDVVRFARGVLLVNEALFRRNAAEFTLLHTERCESGTLAQFQREHDGRATDLVTFYFDPRGNLVEIAHDARD